MNLSSDIVNQVLSLPAKDRYELAQQLLDSIDDAAAAESDAQFLAELRRRREEMLRGEEIVPDWKAALSAIEASLPAEGSG